MIASRVLPILLALLPCAASAQLRVDLELSLGKQQVVVHEQVIVELRVTHPHGFQPRWEEPPFEGFWTERLRASGAPVDGRGRRMTVFRRALFPSRAGTLAIPPSRVFLREGSGDETPHAVAGAQLRVDDLPAEGRPADFSGVVGQVQIQVKLESNEVELGRALPVEINVFGPANVWDAPLPALDDLGSDELELFPARPRIVKSEHRGTLRSRRVLEVDLVPKSTGVYELPVFELAYYDPSLGQYARARSEPLRFRTVPPGKKQARSPWEQPVSLQPVASTSQFLLRALALIPILAIGAGALALWTRRSERILARPPKPRPGVLLRHAREGVDSPAFPLLLRDALRAGIHVRHGVDPTALTTEEIAARTDDEAAVQLLTELDEIRFTRTPARAQDLLERVSAYVDGRGATRPPA